MAGMGDGGAVALAERGAQARVHGRRDAQESLRQGPERGQVAGHGAHQHGRIDAVVAGAHAACSDHAAATSARWRGHGSDTQNTAPGTAASPTQMLPPISSTSWAAIA